MLLIRSESHLEALQELHHRATNQGWLLATAESCTGGLLASLLTFFPGSSQYYCGGITAYSNQAKTELLGVPEATLKQHGAVSEATAYAMLEGALARFHANYAMSVTGVAGPGGGTASKPVGTICIGIAWPGHHYLETLSLGLDRTQNRSETGLYCLKKLLELTESETT